MNKKQQNRENLPKDEILTRYEAAEILKVCVRTLDAWTKQGYFTPKKMKRKIYYYYSDIINGLNSNR